MDDFKDALFKGFRETCFFCNNLYGACICTFDDADDPNSVDEIGFLADGYFITSPNVTECGRFFVDPIVYYGQPYIDWAKEREKVSSV
jgi:hypothetical protein